MGLRRTLVLQKHVCFAMNPLTFFKTLDFYYTKSPSATPKPFFFQKPQFLRCHMSSFSKTSVFTTISEPVATGYVVAGWAGWAAVWLGWLGFGNRGSLESGVHDFSHNASVMGILFSYP